MCIKSNMMKTEPNSYTLRKRKGDGIKNEFYNHEWRFLFLWFYCVIHMFVK